MVEVPAVALRFVRAAPSAITLDFVLATKEDESEPSAPEEAGDGIDATAAPARVESKTEELPWALPSSPPRDVPNGVANDMADEAPTSAGKSVRSRDLDLDWM